MIEDIHEPLEQYAAHFKSAHARHTSEYFEELVRRSGVDEGANVQTVQQLRHLETQALNASSTNKGWRTLRGVVIAAAVLAALYAAFHDSLLWFVVPIMGVPALYRLNRIINESDAQLKRLEEACKQKRAEAWAQMAPLNRLYEWDIAAKLIQKTVPRIEFDPYFATARMEDLCNRFGWSSDLGDDHSILFSHSGVLNGNPFTLARTLRHWMGTKTYEGSLQISWTEEVLDSDGEWQTETRHQTLRASVTYPFPRYENKTFIVYGNEAAPDLVFDRSPSELSNLQDGFFDKMKKKRAIKELELRSREVGEGKTFTVMANREFDALFGATNRNHELQFRLLFTPLAQQEMVKLLKDGQVGYGDDFVFKKQHMINTVESGHLPHLDIGGEPEKFHTYELTQARTFFNEYHNKFFRSFYFGIAPLLAIPLYQQHRPDSDIHKDTYGTKPCFWEHEAMANYHSEVKLQHRDCVTRSILKTSAQNEADGSQTVFVTASGYRSVDRVDYVSVWGGDGCVHEVPVYWSEYIGVQRTSRMLVMEKTSPGHDKRDVSTETEDAKVREVFLQRGVDYQNAILRRSIVSAVLP